MTDGQTHLEAFKRAITEAVDAHLAKGGQIISGSFSRYGCLCPIACYVGVVKPNLNNTIGEESYMHLLDTKLGFQISTQHVWDFINGFDNVRNYFADGSPYYQFGQELRAKIPNLVQA